MMITEILTLVPLLVTFQFDDRSQESAFIFFNFQLGHAFFVDDKTKDVLLNKGLTLKEITEAIKDKLNIEVDIDIPVVPEDIQRQAMSLKIKYDEQLQRMRSTALSDNYH